MPPTCPLMSGVGNFLLASTLARDVVLIFRPGVPAHPYAISTDGSQKEHAPRVSRPTPLKLIIFIALCRLAQSVCFVNQYPDPSWVTWRRKGLVIW